MPAGRTLCWHSIYVNHGFQLALVPVGKSVFVADHNNLGITIRSNHCQ